ncbi:MAG: phosphate acyltransferase PlsX [Bryobacteraceae bacterium]
MTTIAVDAMGGDACPKPEVEGSIQAAKSLGIKVILVGRKEVLTKELDRHPGWHNLPIEIHHASEVITMEDSAGRAVRSKKDSSIRVAARLVREDLAQGVVSAGNTGAIMATTKMVLGMLPGVDRPALASAFPTLNGKPAVMIDVGANVDCNAKMMAQFAVMGEIYSRVIFHTESPRVGILSIGEEEHKGNQLTHDAMQLLKTLHLNFIGNVEGRDVYTGTVDVIVCDGFVGNVALKVSEGLVEVIREMLRESMRKTMRRQVGALLAKGAFQDFKKRVDYTEYGGAPLLGLKGICIICHGRSNAKAIKNAIRVAAEFAAERTTERIATELVRWTTEQAR